MSPTITLDIFDGYVSLYGFGTNSNNKSWSLKGIEVGNKDNYSHIYRAINTIPKIQKIWAPTPSTFNSHIVCGMKGVTHGIACSFSSVLYRGQLADGVILLNPTNAYMMSAADCALVVVRDTATNILFVAHAGRNSLFDRKEIDGLGKSKKFPSVVDAIMHYINPLDRSTCQVFIGFTISKGSHFEHPVDHPLFGESNRNLLRFIKDSYFSQEAANNLGADFLERGQLDMRLLIAQQFNKYGVHNITTDTICTYSDTNTEGSPVWFSERRTPGMRNLFVCVKNK